MLVETLELGLVGVLFIKKTVILDMILVDELNHKLGVNLN